MKPARPAMDPDTLRAALIVAVATASIVIGGLGYVLEWW